MFNYKKLTNYITILTNKQSYLDTYSREIYRANRYDYPISSINIVIPEKISAKKIKELIVNSFRESDVVYCNAEKRNLQVLLPFTPFDHLDIIIERMSQKYSAMKNGKVNNELQCEKIPLSRDADKDIFTILNTIENAENFESEEEMLEAKFQAISRKLLHVIAQGDAEISLMNYYSGIKVNYKATLVKVNHDLYTFKTDSMQLAAINESSQTVIEIKKYGYGLYANVESINFSLNQITLKKLVVMQYNNIYPSSLTVDLKEVLDAKLVSLGSTCNINVTSVSFSEIHGYGDISSLVIDNNTLRLLIKKDEQEFTVLVKFIFSKFNGETQEFTLKILDDSQKSMDLLQKLVAERSRECIQELKRLIS